MKYVLIFFSLYLFSSCEKNNSQIFFNYLNKKTFYLTGELLTQASVLSDLKAFYLDYHNKLGRDVILEGTLNELNSSGTYLVLEDSTGKVLVLTSKLSALKDLKEEFSLDERVIVWGSVMLGRRALPHVKAKAIVLKKDIYKSSW